MMKETKYHLPVMATESIQALKIKPNGIYVDATFGGGGHASLILEQLGPKGKLIAFDRDDDAVNNLINDDRFYLVNHNYAYIKEFISYMGFGAVDGILADLGISSHQIDEPQRGFAHRFDGPLDMRMNQKASLNAATIVQNYSESELASIFKLYGELNQAKGLARAICNARQAEPIDTTAKLIEAVSEFEKGEASGQFRSKLFQALRIVVNDELAGLKSLLVNGTSVLKTDGVFAVISYHSLEDRLVKNFFKTGNLEGQQVTDLFGRSYTPLKVVQSKAIVPQQLEVAQNKRARSAKLRVAYKLKPSAI
jgi:16S rRNA (cytosine1402-N4)-methyltransferase